MTCKIVLLTKLKGGVGASTLTRELCLACIADGFTPALVDLDQQGATVNWWNRRREAKGSDNLPLLFARGLDELLKNLKALKSQVDFIFIDCPPTIHSQIHELAARSDLAIIPARPNIADLDAIAPVLESLADLHNLKKMIVLSQVSPRRSLETEEARDMLEQAELPLLGLTTHRIGYSRPSAHGSTGFEEDVKVRLEIGKLWRNIKKALHITPQKNGR